MLLLRQVGVPIDKSGAAYVLDKTVSLLWLGAVSLSGIVLYSRLSARTWGLSMVFGGVLVVVAASTVTRGLAHTKGWAARLSSVWSSIVRQILRYRYYPRSVGVNFSMTVLKWAVN